jgi:hypothetical protein
MKACYCFCLLFSAAALAQGQGYIIFNNRVVSGSGAQTPVVAPVFGVDPSCPTCQKSGNPTAEWNGSSGPTPVPVGTQTYAGVPLSGTAFTASLWARRAGTADEFVLVTDVPFRTTTAQTTKGFWQPPATPVAVPGIPSLAGVFAEFEVRVWDNVGGTVNSWFDPTIPAKGWSQSFIVPYQLGEDFASAPTLQGLQSFELHGLAIPPDVPEPSTVMIGAIVLVALSIGAKCRRTSCPEHSKSDCGQ